MKKLVVVFAIVYMGLSFGSCTELEDLEELEPVELATGDKEDDTPLPGDGN